MIPVGSGSGRPLFTVLGIPVSVEPWFLLGMLLIIATAPTTRAGVIAAVVLAAFTLAHELGHALAARGAGCTSAIRLSFLVAWASYASTTPLTRRQLVRISVTGPLVQVALGLAGLWALGGPFTAAMRRGDLDRVSLLADFWYAVGWAGVLIGLLNLLPLWPLDGAHVLVRLVESPRRSRAKALVAAARATLAACVALVVVGVAIAQIPALDARRDRWAASHAPFPGDGPLTILGKELLRLPVRLTEPFVIVFVGLFCAMSSYRVLQERRGYRW